MIIILQMELEFTDGRHHIQKRQNLHGERTPKIFTINGAWSLNQEDKSGSIEAGKAADMIVLDRNLFEIQVEDIGETRVLSTIFGGRIVYQRKQSK